MKPKGNKAVFLVTVLHLVLILGFAGYVFLVKFPVVLWDDGLFLNWKFIASARKFLISTVAVWFGAPVLIAVANTAVVAHINRKYLEYIRNVRQICANAENYFQEHYPSQQEAIAQTTYFSARIELLQKDARSLRPEKLTAVFSNLRQCQNLEKEFRDLVRRCEIMENSHNEQDFIRLLQEDFRNHLNESAVLLNQYYSGQMQKKFSKLEHYLEIVQNQPKTEHVLKENPYRSDADFLLAELYAPLETLAQDLRIIAEYLTETYPETVRKNSASELQILPLPEEMSGRLHEISDFLKKIPDSRTLQELCALKDKKYQKYREKFRNYQANVPAWDSCIGLYYQYIADMEQLILKQLLSHYRIVQKAYRMYLPEDSPYQETFAQACQALKDEMGKSNYRWYLYYLHLFAETGHRQCDMPLNQDVQNLQNRLDAVRICAETINQTIRKDEETA
ncbi:MAG: hypothetical protein IJJ69_02650 [Oscillospiraceae bacterium]|nr:hypothetical protein [Oscillospiraceae bacterium]